MIEVRSYSNLSELDRPAMEALNLASRNASPFSSPYWLDQFMRSDRAHLAEKPAVMILVAYEDKVLTGYLALKLTRGWSGRKLSCLITVEVERPQVVALPEDEARVAQAFFRHLVDRRSEWDLLELSQQDSKSALHGGPDFALPRHWMRRLPDRQNNVMKMEFADVKAYATAMSKRMRRNVRTQLKTLFAAPGLTAMVSSEPAARAALFEVFLEIERRSWKERGAAGVCGREATYRAVLADPSAPLEFSVFVLSQDGLPIGGSVWGIYGNNSYYLQSVYAESHKDLSPGTLMTWLPIQSALAAKRGEFNMLPDFSYYKSRWLTETIETESLQLFRRYSRYHAKAVLGDLRRRLRPKLDAPAKVLANHYKEEAGLAAAPAAIDRARIDSLTAGARAAGATHLDAVALEALGAFC